MKTLFSLIFIINKRSILSIHSMSREYRIQCTSCRCFAVFSQFFFSYRENEKTMYYTHRCIFFHSHRIASLFVMSNLLSTIFRTFILGPIIGTSYSSNKWSNLIIIAVLDATLHGICLYLSTETTNGLAEQLIIEQQKQSFQLSQQAMDVLIRTQGDLFDLLKDSVHNDTSNRLSNKLRALEFVQKDSLMIIKKNIDESLDYFNQSILKDSYLFDRIDFYICTSSLLLYIQQLILWFLQYLTTKNPEQYLSCSLILSAIILTRSFGFLYFLQLTIVSPFPSGLSIYICIVFLPSLISIYRHAFGDSIF